MTTRQRIDLLARAYPRLFPRTECAGYLGGPGYLLPGSRKAGQEAAPNNLELNPPEKLLPVACGDPDNELSGPPKKAPSRSPQRLPTARTKD